MGADAPQLVQVGVVVRSDHAAVAQQHGRCLDERALQQRLLGGVLAAVRRERLQPLGRERCGQALELRQVRETVAQVREIARPRRAQPDAREDPLEIADFLEHALQCRDGAVGLEHVDGLLAALELRVVADRPAEPAPKQPAAHRRRAAVHEARERVLVAPTQARFDLEVAARLRVENHGLLAPLAAQRAQVRQRAALRVLRVLEQAARGADAGRRVLGVEARKIERAELLAEQALAGAGIEVPRRPAA